MVNFKKSHRGFTLVEMMIVAAIIGVSVFVGPTMFKNITRFTALSHARLETQRNARGSLSHIIKGLHQAQASSLVLHQESGQPPYSSVSFSTIDGRNLKYYQQGENLNFVDNGSTSTLSTGLRYLSITYPRTDDDNIISVSVTFEKSTYEGGAKTLQMAIEKVRIMNE